MAGDSNVVGLVEVDSCRVGSSLFVGQATIGVVVDRPGVGTASHIVGIEVFILRYVESNIDHSGAVVGFRINGVENQVVGSDAGGGSLVELAIDGNTVAVSILVAAEGARIVNRQVEGYNAVASGCVAVGDGIGSGIVRLGVGADGNVVDNPLEAAASSLYIGVIVAVVNGQREGVVTNAGVSVSVFNNLFLSSIEYVGVAVVCIPGIAVASGSNRAMTVVLVDGQRQGNGSGATIGISDVEGAVARGCVGADLNGVVSPGVAVAAVTAGNV